MRFTVKSPFRVVSSFDMKARFDSDRRLWYRLAQWLDYLAGLFESAKVGGRMNLLRIAN